MKSTFVLTLDADNVAFLEYLTNEFLHSEADELINSLLRQERKRLNLPDKPQHSDFLDHLIDDFTHKQIPAAG